MVDTCGKGRDARHERGAEASGRSGIFLNAGRTALKRMLECKAANMITSGRDGLPGSHRHRFAFLELRDLAVHGQSCARCHGARSSVR
ncbi:MAG: hypothetical protein OXH79_08770 [Boseongicola sp.]|nr:hypothetical protein [Boseongicola sp.]